MLEPHEIPVVAELEALSGAILAEVLAVPADRFVPMPSKDRYTGSWTALLLSVGPWEHEYPGLDFEGNRAACPTIAALLARHPEITLAGVLRLGPGATLQTHNDRRKDNEIRVHLALRLPPAEAAYWPEGTCRLLDVRTAHAAANPTEHDRLTLALDVTLPRDIASGEVAPWNPPPTS